MTHVSQPRPPGLGLAQTRHFSSYASDGAAGSAGISQSPLRLLIFADAHGPTQEISFFRPLAPLCASGAAAIRLIDENRLANVRSRHGVTATASFVREQFAEVRPTVVILSRYSGPDYPLILQLAREWGRPVVCHLDDQLLDPPAILGLEAWARLMQPQRLHALYAIATEADLVYTSTKVLGEQLARMIRPRRLVYGRIYVGGDATPPALSVAGIPPKQPDELRIGYMGSASHVADLEMVRPAILAVLKTYQQATFHLFGSIANTSIAGRFQDRATLIQRIRGGYADFRAALNDMEWDIGLAPLRPMAFNDCKAPTKCIEYFEAGCAAIASQGVVYDWVGAKGAAVLAGSADWQAAMVSLIENPDRRAALVAAGREVLRTEYSWTRLRSQVLNVLALACNLTSVGNEATVMD